ncbi:histone-like nucleoid-structuring protein Lsr2 [Citricoccus zhacaiensis]
MAVMEIRIDDLDGESTEGVETVSIIHEGVTYDIDLSKAHREELAHFLEPYARAGRRQSGRRVPPASEPVATTGKKASKYPDYAPENIRAWAEAAGIEVSERGRIANTVLEQFFRYLPEDAPSMSTAALVYSDPEFWGEMGRLRGESLRDEREAMQDAAKRR